MKSFTLFALPLTAVAASSLVLAFAAFGGDTDVAGDVAESDAPEVSAIVLEIDSEKAAQLMRIGIRPESLCVVGLTPAQAAPVINAGASHFETNGETLATADAAYAAARVARDELQRTVDSGLATGQEVTDLADAKTAFDSAETDREGVLDTAFDAATAGLGTEEKALLETIRANEHWRLPVAYLVADRAEADWVTLRDALVAERLATEEQVATPEPYATFLSTTEGNSDVAAALTGIDTHLTELQAAWDTALETE